MNIYTNIIYNSPKVKTTQMFINKIKCGISIECSIIWQQKGQNTNTCYNVDGP